MPYGVPNPMTKLPPKAPSALHRTTRYAAVLVGIIYGWRRRAYLTELEKPNIGLRDSIFEYNRRVFRRFEYEFCMAEMQDFHDVVFGPPDPEKSVWERLFGVKEVYHWEFKTPGPYMDRGTYPDLPEETKTDAKK